MEAHNITIMSVETLVSKLRAYEIASDISQAGSSKKDKYVAFVGRKNDDLETLDAHVNPNVLDAIENHVACLGLNMRKWTNRRS